MVTTLSAELNVGATMEGCGDAYVDRSGGCNLLDWGSYLRWLRAVVARATDSMCFVRTSDIADHGSDQLTYDLPLPWQ